MKIRIMRLLDKVHWLHCDKFSGLGHSIDSWDAWAFNELSVLLYSRKNSLASPCSGVEEVGSLRKELGIWANLHSITFSDLTVGCECKLSFLPNNLFIFWILIPWILPDLLCVWSIVIIRILSRGFTCCSLKEALQSCWGHKATKDFCIIWVKQMK